jgi:membrane protein
MARRVDTARPVGPDEGPQSPIKLTARSWRETLRRTVREFQQDALTDWAAALTYYGVLSIFPGLIVLISVLGLISAQATDQFQEALSTLAPGQVGDILNGAIDEVQGRPGAAGAAALIGALVAFWSASGYIAAFMRASNTIYDVPEGRPIWIKLRLRIGLTALIGVMLIASAAIVVFTGDLAERLGDLIGIGRTGVTIWNIAKWPVLLILVSLMLGLLYWLSPNARQGGFRWVTPGGLVAVVLWLIVSGGFAVYVGNFASYNRTYGALAGVVIFLVWLWLTNIAVLLGAELDAELERSRAIAAGQPANEEPFLQLRDTRKLKDGGSLR